MNNSQPHIEFTQAEIQRYLAGKMSSAERHAIEKAALQDPFLSDAIEGYTILNDNEAEQRLAAIKNQVLQSKPEAKIVALNTKNKKYWLQIAAAVLLIAGAGIITVYLNNKPTIQNQEIAKITIPPTVKNEPVTPPASINSVEPSTALVKEEKKQVPIKLKEESVRNKEKLAEVSAPMADLASVSQEKIIVQNKIDLNQANATIAQPNAALQPSSVDRSISGRITDEAGKPIATASIYLNKKAYITDKNGSFSINTTESDTLPATVSALGFEPIKANLQSTKENNIILKQNNQSLSEVVVVGYGAAKEKKSISSTTTNSVQELIPNGGWGNYEAYLKESIALAKDSSQTDEYTGTELEITISPDGKPIKVNILNSYNRELVKKITKAIENGPGWVNPSRKQVKKKLLIKVQ